MSLLALVTGASGFAGSYLIEHLMSEGYEAIAGIHGPKTHSSFKCKHRGLDVTNQDEVRRAISELRPDEVTISQASLTQPWGL